MAPAVQKKSKKTTKTQLKPKSKKVVKTQFVEQKKKGTI
jgi:hypothetical protein